MAALAGYLAFLVLQLHMAEVAAVVVRMAMAYPLLALGAAAAVARAVSGMGLSQLRLLLEQRILAAAVAAAQDTELRPEAVALVLSLFVMLIHTQMLLARQVLQHIQTLAGTRFTLGLPAVQ